MGRARERYNARARQSSRPKKRAKRSHDIDSTGNVEDSNALFHVPRSKEQKEEERRQRLRQELLEQQSSKVSSKKKRRLEKYIDKKLKKEGRVQLFERLMQTQSQLLSTVLQSSATLGSRNVRTIQEIQAKLEDKEARSLMEGRSRGRRRRYSGYAGVCEGEDGSDENSDEGDQHINRNVHEGSQIPDTDAHFDVNEGGSDIEACASWHGFDHVQEDKPEDNSESGDDDENDYENENNEEENRDENEGNSSHDDDDDSDSDEDEDEAYSLVPGESKASVGFKEWALQQLNAARAYVAPPMGGETVLPAAISTLAQQLPKKRKKRKKRDAPAEMRGPLGEDLQIPETALARQFKVDAQNADTRSVSNANSKSQEEEIQIGAQPARAKSVTIERSAGVQAARLELPILAEEQPIVEAVRLNPVVVLCGETGSGKTTQVPQFLYEAGFAYLGSENPGMIGITQPRRVAAMSMAARVSDELGLPRTGPGARVAYQVRYDATTAPSTAIKFMTDGVLLRELAGDFLLSRYSVIIVDEAHERSVNTDILIGVLSRVVRLREELWQEGKQDAKPLRLIIMSATLRVSDFAENPVLFSKPLPILRVEARQYPVTMHFARRTQGDYVAEAIKKTIRIHARLPPGGILVFLTGQNEITGVCRKLEMRYGKAAIAARKRKISITKQKAREKEEEEQIGREPVPRVAPAFADVELEEMELGGSQDDLMNYDEAAECKDPDPEALDTDEEEEENRLLGIDVDATDVPMHVLPLYSILSTEQQMCVFETPPTGSRLVVVATNVAETSLTIPGIRYVVDCGRAKERCYEPATGVQSFRVNWVSKASAEQRSGRAGRTGPGHCYRLYSSALYENCMLSFATPEILKMPIEGVVLQMKSMHIDAVTGFPFPTPPDRTRLRQAEKLLIHLGALAPGSTSQSSFDSPITELGRAMALFPLAPRFAKMLVSGRQHGCLPYVIAIVAALSVGDPFNHEEVLTQDKSDLVQEIQKELSEVESAEVKEKELNRLRRKAFFKIQEMHTRLGKGLSDVLKVLSVVGAYEYTTGSSQFCQEHFVRQKAMEEIHKLRAQIGSIVVTNFPETDALLVPKLNPPSDLQIKVLRQLICATFIDQVAVRKDIVQNTSMSGNKYASAHGIPYRAIGIKEDVFIHPSSVLYNQAPPEFIVYQEAVQTNRLWLKTLTVINPAWLSALGKTTMCAFSKPAKNSAGVMMVIPHFGPEGWELPAVRAE